MNELNQKQLQALKDLDAAVYAGATVRIETQFGEIGIRKAGTLGYAADLKPDEEFPERSAYGATPAIALLALRDKLRCRADTVSTSKVIAFPSLECQVCHNPLGNIASGVHFECTRLQSEGDELEAA